MDVIQTEQGDVVGQVRRLRRIKETEVRVSEYVPMPIAVAQACSGVYTT